MIKNEIKLFTMSADGYGDIQCTVPCTLFSVLLDKGYITDPFYSDNLNRSSSKVPESCSFAADVEMSGDALSKKHVYLRLEGICANAEIFFNGRSYGVTSGFNRVYLFDVTDEVVSNDNKLLIKCLSPLPRMQRINPDGSISDKYSLPPYIGDMGICGKCEVMFTNRGFIGDVVVNQTHSEGSVDIDVKPDIFNASGDFRVVATMVSPIGKLFFGTMSAGACKITITDPELWWPTGLGKPSLYKLSVTLYEGEEASDTYETRIGLRDVTFGEGEGGVPALSIGGVSVFPMGASFVCPDAILSRVTKGAVESLIRSASRAGINTLRVVDSGICPPSFFYDLCDKYGIMVYQDIGASYTSSLATSRISQNVVQSVDDVLSKINSHPCVVCAALTLLSTEGGDAPSRKSDSDEFFETLLKMIKPSVKKYTDGFKFFESADCFECYDERFAAGGDYDLCALPSETSLEAFVDGDDMNLLSPAFELHTQGEDRVAQMLREMASVSRFPAGMNQLVYASNFTAAHLFLKRIGLVRAGFLSGIGSAVCRQFNDGWPVTSPSFIDWYGSEKALLHAAAKAYAPISVFVDVQNTKMSFNVINGSRNPFEGKLMIALYTAEDKCLFESVRNVGVSQMTHAEAASEDFVRFIKERGKSDLYALYELSDINGVVFSGVATFVAPKSFNYRNPLIEASVEGSGRSFSVKLAARDFAPGVRVSFDGICVSMSDNFVDLTPVSPVMLKIETDEAMACESLRSRLRINTIYDLGK